jgi:hypothetical protein
MCPSLSPRGTSTNASAFRLLGLGGGDPKYQARVLNRQSTGSQQRNSASLQNRSRWELSTNTSKVGELTSSAQQVGSSATLSGFCSFASLAISLSTWASFMCLPCKGISTHKSKCLQLYQFAQNSTNQTYVTKEMAVRLPLRKAMAVSVPHTQWRDVKFQCVDLNETAEDSDKYEGG